MGRQIIRQPDGRLAVWSSNVDDWIAFDCDEAEVVQLYVDEAAERAREGVLRELATLAAGGQPHYQFTLTFDEAQAQRLEVHGAAEWPPKEAGS